MKITREYILGVGSGLVLSALLSFVLPAGLPVVPRSIPVSNADKATPQIAHGNADNSKPASDADTVTPAAQTQGTNPEKESSGQPQASLSEQAGTVQHTANPSEGSSDAPREFIIPSGASAKKIADLLVSQGFVSDKDQFLGIVEKREVAGRFRAGTYSLPGNLTSDEIITILLNPPEHQ